jgi:hypothetical protein
MPSPPIRHLSGINRVTFGGAAISALERFLDKPLSLLALERYLAPLADRPVAETYERVRAEAEADDPSGVTTNVLDTGSVLVFARTEPEFHVRIMLSLLPFPQVTVMALDFCPALVLTS